MPSIAKSIFDFFFGCRHRQLSRVFTLDQETYRVCLNCGARIPFTDLPTTFPPQKQGTARRPGP